MVQILIGMAAGLIIAAAGLIGYRLGMKRVGGDVQPRGLDAGAAQQQDALMKKYEAILDYDPYGEHV